MWLELREEELAPLVAAQFAGGKTVAELATDWELSSDRIEEMVRAELLRYVPRRSGGTKPPRRDLSLCKAACETDCTPLLFGVEG